MAGSAGGHQGSVDAGQILGGLIDAGLQRRRGLDLFGAGQGNPIGAALDISPAHRARDGKAGGKGDNRAQGHSRAI